MKNIRNTFQQKTADVKRNWVLVDAKGQILGKVATQISRVLMGKHKPTYTSHIDGGDYVVVINAKQVVVTGNKAQDKKYYDHSQYPSGLRTESYSKLMERNPSRIIERAVKGMLPGNKLQDVRMTRLKVFATDKHKYEKLISA